MARSTLTGPLRALLAACALACAMAQAQADPFTALGRTLQLEPPAGFCTLGDSAAEREFLAVRKRYAASYGELAQFAVPCSELAEIRAGRRDQFTRWAQVLVLPSNGQLVHYQRAEFVRQMARRFTAAPPDSAALEARVRKDLEKSGTSFPVTNPSAQLLGASPDAYYAEFRLTQQMDSGPQPTVGVSAITTARQLPLGIYAYAFVGAPGESAFETAQRYLRSVIARN
ncbi:hypothetical protein [Acidovorax sp.]|uniref:hypothetical protein n=1 Tax=Acidovorax sp. TaxID=1872122 RepID=UPI003CFBCB1D